MIGGTNVTNDPRIYTTIFKSCKDEIITGVNYKRKLNCIGPLIIVGKYFGICLLYGFFHQYSHLIDRYNDCNIMKYLAFDGSRM
jgi:hypothetical protein